MSTGSAEQGGSNLHRGIQFECASLLYYMLLRWSSQKDAVLTLETEEDATVIYQSASPYTITEYIQCKKAEHSTLPTSSTVDQGFDDWQPRQSPLNNFVAWVSDSRGGTSSIDRLDAD